MTISAPKMAVTMTPVIPAFIFSVARRDMFILDRNKPATRSRTNDQREHRKSGLSRYQRPECAIIPANVLTDIGVRTSRRGLSRQPRWQACDHSANRPGHAHPRRLSGQGAAEPRTGRTAPFAAWAAGRLGARASREADHSL